MTRTIYLFAIVSASMALPAPAQEGPVPREGYYLVFTAHYAGEYTDSAKAFRNVAGTGVRSVNGRWIDSICYHTMVGECFYQMGDYPQALEQYETALRLAMAHSDWMLRVRWPNMINASSDASLRRINWGPSTRRTAIGKFPDTLLSQQGRADNQNVVKQGGVVSNPRLVPVGAMEIARCTALAIQRRGELLGPTGPHSALSNQLVGTLSQRSAPPNHWSQTLLGVQLGLAYSAAGQKDQAVNELQRSLQVAGRFDHPLTGMALLELGKIALEQDKLDAAARFFFEATFSAAAFDQPDIVDQAFRLGASVHMVTGKPGVYPPLAGAAAWARSQRYTQLEASLYVAAAENFAHIGDLQPAGGMLNNASRELRRTDMASGLTGARYQYQVALLNYQNGNAAAGDAALADLMAFQAKGSQRLFQIKVADAAYVSDGITPRDAVDLFATVLREPTPHDWALEPMESLSVTSIPHLLPMEHWFEAVLSRPENKDAVRIADLVRRHRFYSTLPMGGRLLSFRWIMAAPEHLLTNDDLLRRQDILARYPAYAKLDERSNEIRTELAALPLAAPDAKAAATERKLLEELGRTSTAQELFLRALALRREPARFVFPPVGDLPDVQARLPEGRLALAFFATSRYVFAFLFTKEEFAYWQVEKAPEVAVKTKELLKAVGQLDANQPISAGDLASEAWREPARETLSLLMNSDRGDFWGKYEELIVVPDGVVWHIPFEMLRAGNAEESFPLIDKVRVRVVPTVGAIAPRGRRGNADRGTAFVTGKLFPRDNDSVAQEALDQIEPAIGTVVKLSDDPPATSATYASRFDRLVVWDDVDDLRRGPVGFAPFQLDGGKPGSALGDWVTLPWNAPGEVILPGFHTAAEDAFKQSGPAAGNELFLTTCALMASGNETALLSRWRTGGQTSVDLVREYLQTSSHAAPSQAWRRSILLSRENPLDPARAPRVAGLAGRGSVPAEHPFFWAGYLLVDLRGE